MGFLKPKTPTVQATPTPDQVLQPTQSPQGSSPIGGSSQAPSFLASISLPPPGQPNQGGKALLGK